MSEDKVFLATYNRDEFVCHTIIDLLQSCVTAKDGILDQGKDKRDKQISVRLLPPH